MKIVTQNRKAFYDYEVLDKIEAGIVLSGDEVKAIRAGHITLTGAFANIHKGELFLLNCNITPYKQAYIKKEGLATRSRKLLIKRRELNRLVGDVSQKGVILVPLKVYFNEKNRIKVEIGVCKHKKLFNKKEKIKERDINRETSRTLKNINRW